MYAADVLAGLFIIMFIAYNNFNAGFASFIGGLGSTAVLIILFALIIASFVFGLLDVNVTNKRAEEIILRRIKGSQT